MGDWVYYVAFMNFEAISEWIKPVAEVHKTKRLREWIQRVLREGRPTEIADYLVNQPQRFFNAIVVGVYGGEPQWYSFRILPTKRKEGPSIDAARTRELEGEVGFLYFQGTESLFAIDGQHRVAGIVQAVHRDSSLSSEEVAVILVAHQTNAAGLVRTRRLFTTLNKTARPVAPRDIIALDEDNGFAIITRRLVEDFNLLRRRKIVALKETASLAPENRRSLTSIVALYSICQDLHPIREGHPTRKELQVDRPSDGLLDELYSDHTHYWSLLADRIPEYRQIFNKKRVPGDYRREKNNHLLFRPVGQRAFAQATRCLVRRSYSVEAAVEKLRNANLRLDSEQWHHLLWDPVNKKMISSSPTLATSYLLHQVQERAPTEHQAEKLAAFLREREQL